MNSNKLVINREVLDQLRIKKRQNFENERKKRIFNARERLIGVDTDYLKNQITDRKTQQSRQKRELENYAQHANAVDEKLVLYAKEKEKLKLMVEKEQNEFRIKHQQADKKREWDIYDPFKLRKDVPPRLDDNDVRCGPSSMQMFAGEDLSGNKRADLQKEQNRIFWERQITEKQNKMEQLKREKLLTDINLSRTAQYEMNRAASLKIKQKQLTVEQSLYNKQLANDVKSKKEQDRSDIEQYNAIEQANARESDFLVETRECAQSCLQPNRVIPYSWKGMTPEQLTHIRNCQMEQINNNASKKELEKRNLEKMDNYLIQNDMHNVLRSRDEERRKKITQKQLVEENRRLAQIKKQEFDHLNNEVYKNNLTEDYFNQFNTTTR